MQNEYRGMRTNNETRRNSQYSERSRSSQYSERPRSSQYTERQKAKKENTKAADINFIRMVACSLVLLAVIAARIFLPEKTAEISERVLPLIEEDFDYKRAVTSIGEALSGDESIVQVLGNIYAKAFNIVGEEDIQESENDGLLAVQETLGMPPTERLHRAASRIGSVRAARLQDTYSQENIDDTEQAEVMDSNKTAETTDEVVEAFLLSQQVFSGYALPSNVTYEKPELGITYSYPIVGRVSSEFGYRNHPLEGNVKFHYGTDIAANTGDAIASFADGTVVAVSESTVSGLNVTIQHSGNIYTRYCHCSEIYVNEGDIVAAGDIIAAAGATGNVTGPHLHLELKVNGLYVNPEYYLNFSYT